MSRCSAPALSSAVVSTLIPPLAQMASAISSVIASPHSAPAASDCTSADSGCASAAAMSASRPPASAMCFAISSVTVKLRSAPAVPASTCDEGRARRGEHLHAVKASMFDEGANPRPSEPIGAHRSSSNAEAIKCHPWQSVAISGNQSGDQSGNQWRSEAIRGHPWHRRRARRGEHLLVLWVRPCGGNERFDPTRERDGFRNLLHEGQIPQCRRHLRQTPGRSSAPSLASDAREVISRNAVPSACTDAAGPRRHLRLNRCTLEVHSRSVDEHLEPLCIRNRLFRVI